MKTLIKVVSIYLVAWLIITPARADNDPAYLSLGVGAIGVIANREQGSAFNIEYRSDIKFWEIHPFIGGFATSDASLYGYFGFLMDIYFGSRWILTPNTAVGAYLEGDGQDLGHALEFRSGFELAYRLNDRSRLGIAVHHLSNAGIGNDNPGTETALLYYSIPLNNLFD